MTTQPPVFDEATNTSPSTEPPPTPPRGRTRERTPRVPISKVLRELNWRLVLPVGVGLGIFWVVLLGTNSTFTLVASLLPVLAGFIVGRRVQTYPGWHGIMLSLFATVAALISAFVLLNIVGPGPIITQLFILIPASLLPFPALGAFMSARTEARNRAAREEVLRRGGRLDRPGKVRSLDDLRALSLPQLGGYVADLFRKHGFTITDYRIENDKDRIDFWVAHDDTPWLLRVTTAEKVKPGVVQELGQRMKTENISKGVAITSMDFQEASVRWSKNKSVALIDGPTLLTMDD